MHSTRTRRRPRPRAAGDGGDDLVLQQAGGEGSVLLLVLLLLLYPPYIFSKLPNAQIFAACTFLKSLPDRRLFRFTTIINFDFRKIRFTSILRLYFSRPLAAWPAAGATSCVHASCFEKCCWSVQRLCCCLIISFDGRQNSCRGVVLVKKRPGGF